jgi:NADH-ubiquinone oxidoreductase chain 2
MTIFSIILLLLSNAVNIRRDSSILYSRIGILILSYSSLILYFNLDFHFLTNGLPLFGGLITFTYKTLIFSIFIYIITSFILSITSFYPRKIISSFINISNYKKGEQQKIIEYPIIILFCITGAIFLMSSSDIISIFLSIELQSYALYLLCSIYRNSEQSVSAGLTYFLLGGLSSCIILLGQSFLYFNTGHTSLENIYIIKNIYDTFFFDNDYNTIASN